MYAGIGCSIFSQFSDPVRLLWYQDFSVCVSLFYVIDTGSIGSRARIEMGVTYLPSAFAQTLAMPIYP